MKNFFIAIVMFVAFQSNVAFGASGVSQLRAKFETKKVETPKAPAAPGAPVRGTVVAAKPEVESKKALAAPKAAVGAVVGAAKSAAEGKCPTELEVTRKALEDAHQVLVSIFAELEVPAVWGGLNQQKSKDMRDKINAQLDSLFWTSADTDLKEAWGFLQNRIYGHTPLMPEGANPWKGWDEQEWAKKEEIISSKPGQGTIWKINPEFGEFLTIYMQDYDKLKSYRKRMILIGNVGIVVPSLYAHGPTLPKQTLQNAITEVIKVAPATGKILQAKFNQRVG